MKWWISQAEAEAENRLGWERLARHQCAYCGHFFHECACTARSRLRHGLRTLQLLAQVLLLIALFFGALWGMLVIASQ